MSLFFCILQSKIRFNIVFPQYNRRSIYDLYKLSSQERSPCKSKIQSLIVVTINRVKLDRHDDKSNI